MSKIEVDKVDPQSGTALEIGTSGDTVTVPSGVGLTLTDSTLLLPTTITSTTEVKTNKISPATGVAFALGDSGDTITVPTGAGLTVTDEVKTNKISPATGVAFALGDSGDTFTVPSGATIVNSGTATGFGGGKIGQVVQSAKTDTFTMTTAGTWIDVTDMSVAITPSAATSKILIGYEIGMVQCTTTFFSLQKMVRDINGGGYADFCIGDAAGSRLPTTTWNYPTNAYMAAAVSMLFLDSPTWTTGAITYKLQIRTDASNMYFNRSQTDADSNERGRSISTITAMEVLA